MKTWRIKALQITQYYSVYVKNLAQFEQTRRGNCLVIGRLCLAQTSSTSSPDQRSPPPRRLCHCCLSENTQVQRQKKKGDAHSRGVWFGSPYSHLQSTNKCAANTTANVGRFRNLPTSNATPETCFFFWKATFVQRAASHARGDSITLTALEGS